MNMRNQQDAVFQWVQACFGPGPSFDRAERHHRFLEEALELSQAGGMTKEQVLELVDYTYGREMGDVPTELGDAGMTLMALSSSYCLNLDVLITRIQEKCWRNIDKIRTKWENKPPGVKPQ